MTIKKIKSTTHYQGKIFNVRTDEMLEHGKKYQRDIVEHTGGVCVLAINEADTVFCVIQYRYGQQMEILELPAGKLEKNEDPLLAAKRELQEETGYVAKSWESMGVFIPSGAYLEEKIYLYVAKELSFIGQNLDEDEHIEVQQFTIEEMINKIMNNEIIDGKTMAVVLKYYNSIKQKHNR